MPLDPEFLADCPYLPEAVYLDELLAVDRAESLVRARMPARADLPFAAFQRTHAVRHPAHVPGGVLVHATGILGFLHAYYVLDLRHAQGWTGYGTRIHDAGFRALAPLGSPLTLECRATNLRRRDRSLIGRYHFRITQNDKLVYESDQSAMFTRFDGEE